MSSPESTTGYLTHFFRRIDECSQDASKGPVTIVALGDSVTAGAGPGDTIYVDEVYHARLRALLEKRYPACSFQVINVAIGGEAAGGGLSGFDERVAPHKTDLLLIAYGLNDAVNGMEGLDSYRDAIEGIVTKARQSGDYDIMLLSSNMMPVYAAGNVPDRWSFCTENFIKLQRDGVLANFAGCLKSIAKEQGVAFANVYAAWEELHAQGVDTTAMLVNGLNHPDEEGHIMAARVIMEVIETEAEAI